ncbi:MAG: chromosomal replication initiator protein DnaA [bacterium]|nr:chromosomal replication initiator protein DnaA [bacterium]
MTAEVVKPSQIPFADESIETIWRRITNEIAVRIGSEAFRVWFEPLLPLRLEIEDEKIVVAIPSEFHKEWVISNFSEAIRESIELVLGVGFQIQYEITHSIRKVVSKPVVTQEVLQLREPPKRELPAISMKIMKECTFDTYIADEGSRIARSAALAVANSPGGSKFNPLLIHGGVGLGKTHLLHAIAGLALELHPHCVPILTTSEQFTADFIRAVQHDKKLDFADQYANATILLVDDVQFLIGREQTQRQFFHTFNSLINAGKQIVMTSDRPPRELDGLDERLRSRFSQGLVVEVLPPAYETRIAILRVWAEKEGLSLPKDVEEFLATHITSNVRNLRGAIVRLLAISDFTKGELTVATARRAVHDLLERKQSKVSIERIIEIVCKDYNIHPDLLADKTRRQPIAEARMVVMAIACELTGLSLNSIGAKLGGRDHTTIMHARDTIRQRCENDLDFKNKIESYRRQAEQGLAI